MSQNELLANRLSVDEAKREGLALMNRAKVCMLGTVDDQGYPNMKAVFNMEAFLNREIADLKHVWFGTNTSSKRVAQLKVCEKASVYFHSVDTFQGLMLVGRVDVRQDYETKARFWFDGADKYYRLGIDDPDYSVLMFTAEWANYYHRLQNVRFAV